MNLIDRVFECIDLMKTAVAELKERAIKRARSEAHYQKVKYTRAFQMKAQGVPVTFIALVIKGDPEVNKALLERDSELSLYESTKEEINVYKLEARLIEEQIKRDYNETGEF